MQPPWKAVWRLLKKLKMELPCEQTILFLGIICFGQLYQKAVVYSCIDLCLGILFCYLVFMSVLCQCHTVFIAMTL
jgi:hypothetical protein